MPRSPLLLTLICLAASCGTTPDKALPREAATAMTGSPATLNDISRTLMVQGSGEMLNVEQGLAPEAEPPKLTVTHYQRVFEFGRRRWRQDLTGIANDSAATPQRQITAVDGDVAFSAAPDGTAMRATDQVARQRRAELYYHPIGFLQAVFSGRGIASNTRREGNFEAVDMTIDGSTYTMFVDPATKLPARITSRGDTPNLRDVLIETTLGNYTTVQGHRLPGRMTTRLDRWVISDITFNQQSLAGNFGDLAAPAAVRNGAAPPAARLSCSSDSRTTPC